MLLRAVDRQLVLCRALDGVLEDRRAPDLITHRQIDLLRQRIIGLALDYEDLNDHDHLRRDLAWQTAVEQNSELASSPTLCRSASGVDAGFRCHRRSGSRPTGRALLSRLFGTDAFLPLYVFLESNSWSATFGPATLIRLATVGRSSNCWSGACTRPFRTCALS